MANHITQGHHCFARSASRILISYYYHLLFGLDSLVFINECMDLWNHLRYRFLMIAILSKPAGITGFVENAYVCPLTAGAGSFSGRGKGDFLFPLYAAKMGHGVAVRVAILVELMPRDVLMCASFSGS